MISSYTTNPELARRIPEQLLIKLPEICYEGPQLAEADYYGASSLIASELRIPNKLRTSAMWSHGWVYDKIRNYKQIAGEHISQSRKYLVRNKEEAEVLAAQGLDAEAVGLPFLYVLRGTSTIPRVPGSLLIMPTHGTTHTPVKEENSIFMSRVSNIRKQFSCVVGCISGMCVSNNQWIRQLETNEIPWVTGAWVFDRNALKRMRAILESFEYVLTNSFGSHLLYASAVGCKVVCDLELEVMPSIQDLLATEPCYQRHPELLEEYVRDFKDPSSWHRFIAFKYPHFFQGLEQATQSIGWARTELGEEFMRSGSSMAALLGWQPDEILAGKLAKWPVSLVPLSFDFFAEDPIGKLIAEADNLQNQCQIMLNTARMHFNGSRYSESLQSLAWIKSQRVPCQGADQLRSLIYKKLGDHVSSLHALREEVALSPSNIEASRMLIAVSSPLKQVVDLPLSIDIVKICSACSESTSAELNYIYQIALKSALNLHGGCFVECGVGEGGSSALLAWVLSRYSVLQREILCFDSFEGYPSPSKYDTLCSRGNIQDYAMGEGTSSFPPSTLDRLAAKIGLQKFIRVIPGMFDVSLPIWRSYILPISLLHVDTGLYSSTNDVLECLVDLVAPGGSIYVSKYNVIPGVRLALDNSYGNLECIGCQFQSFENGGLLITFPQ